MSSPVRRRLEAARREWKLLATDRERARFRAEPVRRDTVFYESFSGNGMLCNPEAIFRRLLDDGRFAHLDHVWSLSERNDNSRIRGEFRGHPRVRFVDPGSRDFARAQLTSGFLITNATFDRQFVKRDGQLVVNTWHGTPLKKMGYDIGDSAFRVANVLRNFLQADYLVSPNAFTSDTLFRRAHRLAGLYPGTILEVGSPRIDRQTGGEPTADAARALLADRGFDLTTRPASPGPASPSPAAPSLASPSLAPARRLVLWAPTWKGTNFARPEDDAAELIDNARALQARLGDDHLVLLKTHQVVHHFAARRPEAAELLVPNDLPTNLLLAATDVLVTDYSSIFFDFLSLQRPIVFFAPDIGDYSGYRGLYLEPESWPGPIATSVDDAAAQILRLEAPGTDLGPAHEAMRLELTPHDDGHAAERVIDAVFGPGRPTSAPARVDNAGESRGAAETTSGAGSASAPRQYPRESTDPDRPRLLFSLNSAVSPERLDEAILLLNRQDFDRTDVSVVLSDSRREPYLAAQNRLDPRVRRFVRQGRIETTPAAWLRRRVENRRGRHDADATVPVLRALWDHEWRRLFADVRFDAVIDLVATEPFWLTLLLHSGAETVAWRGDTGTGTGAGNRPGKVTGAGKGTRKSKRTRTRTLTDTDTDTAASAPTGADAPKGSQTAPLLARFDRVVDASSVADALTRLGSFQRS